MTTHSDAQSHRAALRSLAGRVLGLLATVAAMLGGGALMLAQLPTPQAPAAAEERAPIPLPSTPLSIDGAATLGSPEAPVVMIAFSEFQCPFSAKFTTDVLPEFTSKFVDTNQVQVVFRHWPLPIHDRATRAAEAASCANAQGRFWPMHDVLFKAAGRFSEDQLSSYATQAHLDPRTFAQCLASGRTTDQIDQDAALAISLKLTGTPTFLIGPRVHSGVQVTNIVVGPRAISEFADALQQAAARPLSPDPTKR